MLNMITTLNDMRRVPTLTANSGLMPDLFAILFQIIVCNKKISQFYITFLYICSNVLNIWMSEQRKGRKTETTA